MNYVLPVSLQNTPIVLASASPRRKELLESIGLPFTVHVSAVDEENIPLEGMSVAEQVLTLAAAKADAVAALYPMDHLVIGADTLVAFTDSNEIFGKPKTPEDAVDMLMQLQGRQHSVFSAIAVLHQGRCERLALETKVWMRPMSDADVQAYVASGEPLDKAGAYAIQGLGSVNIIKIEGCYFNVVGLSLVTLRTLLFNVAPQVLESAV